MHEVRHHVFQNKVENQNLYPAILSCVYEQNNTVQQNGDFYVFCVHQVLTYSETHRFLVL